MFEDFTIIEKRGKERNKVVIKKILIFIKNDFKIMSQKYNKKVNPTQKWGHIQIPVFTF